MPKNNLGDLNNLEFTLHKNKVLVQEGNTHSMLWNINEIIAYISQYFTLKKGDIIFTGTPAGVGKVTKNDQLVGKLGHQELFSVKVK